LVKAAAASPHSPTGKEALRVEFGDGLWIAQRVQEPGGKLRRDILGRMSGRSRDKPDVCLKIL
jgi:hypothetical protein